MAQMGRRSLLTDELFDQVKATLRSGTTIADTCEFVGIAQRTYYDWVQRGEEYQAVLDDGAEPNEREEIYRQFAVETRQSRVAARVNSTFQILKAAKNDWRAAAWYLERSDPTNWGRINRVEMTGAHGGPVQLADVTEHERRLVESLGSLREELERSGTPLAQIERGDDDIIDAEIVVTDQPTGLRWTMDDDEDDYPYAWPVADDYFE